MSKVGLTPFELLLLLLPLLFELLLFPLLLLLLLLRFKLIAWGVVMNACGFPSEAVANVNVNVS